MVAFDIIHIFGIGQPRLRNRLDLPDPREPLKVQVVDLPLIRRQRYALLNLNSQLVLQFKSSSILSRLTENRKS